MTNIKVSVIIPVYNVEKYLEECLDSIVNQTLRETEIICVNDGSTDGSPEILQKYAAKDKRITVCTQENRGVSAARNKGVAQARGKYLYFMDSDDILELSALEILYEKAEADNLDVIYFNGVAFTNEPEYDERANRLKKIYTLNSDYKGVDKGPALLSKMVERNEYRVNVYFQFINRNYYVRNKLSFHEGILYSEDCLFNYQCMLTAGRVRFLPLQLNRRRFRSDSLMTRKESFAIAYGWFICYLEMKRFYKEHHIADMGDKMLFKPVRLALSNTRSAYRPLPPEERQKVATLPDEQRQIYQTLVVDVCNKRDKAEARKQKLLAPFVRLIALKNSLSSKIGRK